MNYVMLQAMSSELKKIARNLLVGPGDEQAMRQAVAKRRAAFRPAVVAKRGPLLGARQAAAGAHKATPGLLARLGKLVKAVR